LKASLRSFSRFAVALVLLLAGVHRSLGSGGPDCDDFNCSTFFAPEIIESPQERPFFLSNSTFYSEPAAPVNDQERLGAVEVVNLDEWFTYYDSAIAKTELSFLLYKMPLEDVQALAAVVAGKKAALTKEAQTLSAAFLKYGKKDRVLKSLEYLALAKRVEPVATRQADDPWEGKKSAEPVDPASVRELIAEAESRIRESDKFIAQRYRFQVLRLMFYSGQYGTAQNYFEQTNTTFAEENSPKYRVTALAAGAYYKDKKYGKANYLFSLVFDRFPPLKRSAYLSFHPMEDADWRETLAQAKDAHEREVLWQLLGVYADGMAAINEIYAMNPKSTLLPLLLVREVNKAENDWTANQERRVNGLGNGDSPRTEAEVVGAIRLARIKAIADAGNAYKAFLWQLSAGHLYALAGDSRTAEMYIDKAAASAPKTPDIQAQVRMSRLLARVRSLRSVDRAAEPYFVEEYSWLSQYQSQHDRAVNLNEWTLKQLSSVYLKAGDPVRSLMLTDNPEDSIYRTTMGIDRILAFMPTATTAFDKFLVKNYRYSAEELQELRGLDFLYAGDFTQALATFRNAGDAVRMDLPADPFTIHIKDCHDCDSEAPHTKYSKASFAERMLSLSRAAEGQGETAAAASFELANGFYNMSYYGNGRAIYDNMHSNLGPRDTADRNAELPLNVDLAEKYYLQASSQSSNREFKAKALFMAAKTEQNRYYNMRKSPTDPQPQRYFGMLKAAYSNTQYYQEIIRECGTFRTYLQR
jgi:hypothetical protein